MNTTEGILGKAGIPQDSLATELITVPGPTPDA